MTTLKTENFNARINAGFLGFDKSNDKKIIQLLKQKYISTSSMIVNRQCTEECIKDFKQYSQFKGLMLNLTQQSQNNGLNQGDIKSTVKGCPTVLMSARELRQKLKQNKINIDDLKTEIRAQIYKFIELVDELPQFIDCLDQIHEIPQMAEIIGQIITQEFGIYEAHIKLNIFQTKSVGSNQQIQQQNEIAKIYSNMNIKPMIFVEIEELKQIEQEQLKNIISELKTQDNTNLYFGITLIKQQITSDNNNIQFIISSSKKVELISQSQRLNQSLKEFEDYSSKQSNILIYSKINPATGNQTFALRLKKIFELKYKDSRKVYLRGIDQFNQNDQKSFDKEVKNISQFIKDNNIGICLGINVYRTSIILSHAKQFANFELVSIIAGTDAYEFLEDKTTASQMEEACNNSSLIVSLNEEMKQNFVKQLQIPEHKIPVVNQSIDLTEASSTFNIRQQLNIGDNDKLILFPAGVRPVKNCMFLLEPMKEQLLKNPNHYFVHVGSILDQKYYKEYMKKLNEIVNAHPSLKNRMIFYGSLDYSQYLGSLQKSDLILNSSFSEGQCNAILEAMGSKIPSLVCRIEGNLSICEDGETSVMFEGEEEFMSNYDKIFNSEIYIDQITENAKQKFQRCYSFEIEAKGYIDLFDKYD